MRRLFGSLLLLLWFPSFATADAQPEYQPLAFLGREYDPPGDQADDLADDGDRFLRRRFAQEDRVRFVLVAGELAHRVAERGHRQLRSRRRHDGRNKSAL